MRGIAQRIWANRGIGAAGIAGLALVAAAVLLVWSSGPTGQGVPGVRADDGATATVVAGATATAAAKTATAQANKDCSLTVSKDANKSSVAEGGTVTYTITVTNDGSNSSGECSDLTVKDKIPADTDCSDASVTSDSDISESHFDISGCSTSGTVKWTTDSNLGTDNQVVLTMVLDLTSGASDGDTIDNEACATSTDDESGDCDSASTDVTSATATPTTAPVPTTAPATAVPVRTAAPVVVLPPAPTAVVAPLVVPRTGSGPDSSGSNSLALALGLTGGALVLLSGTGLWLRRRS